MAKKFGAIEFEVTADLKKLPQKAASALAVIEDKTRVGATFKVLVYVGKQLVNGTNYVFVAEETLSTANFDKHIVLISVNEKDGKFEIAKSSIIRII